MATNTALNIIEEITDAKTTFSRTSSPTNLESAINSLATLDFDDSITFSTDILDVSNTVFTSGNLEPQITLGPENQKEVEVAEGEDLIDLS